MSDTETWTAEQYQHYMRGKKQPSKKRKPSSEGVGKIKLLLDIEGIEYVQEYQFLPDRKFRLDFAIPEKKIGIEYEGIMNGKSRHTSVTGYSKDTEKYNMATAAGWRIFRYTILTYGNILNDIKPLL